MLKGAVFILVTVQNESRAVYRSQIIIKRPIREGRREPGLDPGVQNPTSLHAVVSFQALQLSGPLKLGLPCTDTVKCLVLDKTLRRLGYHGGAPFGQVCRRGDCHRTTNAMSERDDCAQSEGFTELRHYRQGLIADERERGRTRAGI
jgi:hypothetical protein